MILGASGQAHIAGPHLAVQPDEEGQDGGGGKAGPPNTGFCLPPTHPDGGPPGPRSVPMLAARGGGGCWSTRHPKTQPTRGGGRKCTTFLPADGILWGPTFLGAWS